MDIIEINRRSVFSLEEARELLPVVFRITKVYAERVEAMVERLEAIGPENEQLVTGLETQINSLIQEWQCKVQKLGALPKGLWLADFDAGDGYYCWKYPERGIDYWHHYRDGFSKRVPVSEKPATEADILEGFSQKLFASPAIHLQSSEVMD